MRQMISSSFLTDQQTRLVIDASVAINLNATNRAAEIISALPGMMVVTQNAIEELEGGARKGHNDAQLLQDLVAGNLVFPVSMGENSLSVYEALIDGNASCTLDDGEAATIAYAIEAGGIAVIDERKARRICEKNFPNLRLLSTVDLLLDSLISKALGHIGRKHPANPSVNYRVRPRRSCPLKSDGGHFRWKSRSRVGAGGIIRRHSSRR